ncbi:MAG: hypothetical protein HKN22_05550, partial [Bacteroidia bacterium]|nr:hypothetical protein [Bacteroidia bacterium]
MNTQEIKGSFISTKSQLIILNSRLAVEYSCDQLKKIIKSKEIFEQLPFLQLEWNQIDAMEANAETYSISAVLLENANEENKLCDVQINKVKFNGNVKYHIFMIDAFQGVASSVSENANTDFDLSSADHSAINDVERSMYQHYQLNFNEQINNDFSWPLFQIMLSADALRKQIDNTKSLAFINLITQATKYLDSLSRRNLDIANTGENSNRFTRQRTD